MGKQNSWFHFVIVGVLCFIFSAIIFIWGNQFDLFGKTRTDEWGQLGDFFGGVFGTVVSFVTIYFVYQTYILQGHEISMLQSNERRKEIENRFFILLDIHRQNVKEMEVEFSPDIYTKEYRKGRDVFVRMYNDFSQIHRQVQDLLTKSLINKEGISDSKKIFLEKKRDEINISYYLFSFGVRNDSLGERDYKLKEILSGYSDTDKDEIIYKIDSDSTLQMINKSFPYQGLLSHYYRHLFQMVLYIDKQIEITPREKYQYISLLRAQLSPYEQVLFFYNSLSSLGEEWEWKHQDLNIKLITKYNLIKNMFRVGIGADSPQRFYGLIEFEYMKEDARKHQAEMRKNAGLIYDEKLA